jgi:hypothetical protein
VLVVGLLAATGAAGAGPLIRADFDATNPTLPFGYAGNFATMKSAAVVDGAGVAGSRAYQLVVDATAADPSFYRFGAGVVQTSPFAGLTRPGSLSDLTYSAAVSLGGAQPGVTSTPVAVQVEFRVPDGPDPDVANDVVLVLEQVRAVKPDGTFQTVAGDFGGARVVEGSLAALQAAVDGGQLRQVQLLFDVPNGVSDFGRDDGNTLRLDDVVVSVTPVPEPGVVGLGVGVAAIGLGRRGRRGRAIR